MFEDLLNQKPYLSTQDLLLTKSYTMTDQCEASIDLDIPSKYTEQNDLKEMQLTNLYRQSTQQTNSFIVKKEKVQKQKKKRIRKYISNNPNNKKGHWTQQENIKYHYFLEAHASFFIDSERRKIDKIFKAMSCFIQTREPHQCRSHHQKIQKKWGSFSNILLSLRLQNFKQTKGKKALAEFLRLGYDQIHIFEDFQLENEEQLQKIVLQSRMCQKKCQNKCVQQHIFEQNNQIFDNLMSAHQPNCLCLMMSDRYEDHLLI